MKNLQVLHGLITSILGLNGITETIFLEKFSSPSNEGLKCEISNLVDDEKERQTIRLFRDMGPGHGGNRQLHLFLDKEVCKIAFMFEPGCWYKVFLKDFSNIEDPEFIEFIKNYFSDTDTDFLQRENCVIFMSRVPFRI